MKEELNRTYRCVGRRIREQRIKYGLSLQELAEKTGLSPSFLSLLENGKTIPSLKTLDKLTTFFSIHIADLFAVSEKEEYIHLSKENQIEVVNDDNKTSLRFLLPKSINSALEPVLIVLEPNSVNRDFTAHRGVEFGYVLEGEITVSFMDKDSLLCREGDSIIYRADLQHRLVNKSDKVAKGIWIGVQGYELNI